MIQRCPVSAGGRGSPRPGAGQGPGSLVERWRPLAIPFTSLLARQHQQDHACGYIAGLLSGLGNKTAEAIAYFLNEKRHGLQRFLGSSPWDWAPLAAEMALRVGGRWARRTASPS